MKHEWSRREFLKFLGQSGLVASSAVLMPMSLSRLLWAESGPFDGLSRSLANSKDTLHTAAGVLWERVLSYEDEIFPDGRHFGYNNDFIGEISLSSAQSVFMVNHESVSTLLVSGRKGNSPTLEQAKKERQEVGVSVVVFEKDKEGKFNPVKGHRLNKRIDSFSKIPFAANVKVKGSNVAEGTLANCSGGVTPWKTFLTCEENYDDCVGDYALENGKFQKEEDSYGWTKHFKFQPEHYGWVVEVDPMTGKAKKHTSMGRFLHEGAFVVRAKDGTPVVYMGDDREDACIFKFVSDSKTNLDSGTLFVADTKNEKWIPLLREKSKKLKEAFASQLEVMIYAREAARLVGGTPLDRPEGIAVNPKDNSVFVSLTGNAKALRFYGSIAKLVPANGDHKSEEFKFSTFVSGGSASGLLCPDNVAFDSKGNLWVTNDVSEKLMGKGPYSSARRNGLFVVPTSGLDAGRVFQIASAPPDAELTGPCFCPSKKAIYVSVQHPGSGSQGLDRLSSHWPFGGKNIPKPSVVRISGPLIEKLIS
ncbi:DUF839 domain-containing protein [bacterium]|nr:DUF839 domain-containing protein [bacterium]